jgi:hypothetical protein
MLANFFVPILDDGTDFGPSTRARLGENLRKPEAVDGRSTGSCGTTTIPKTNQPLPANSPRS